MQSPEMSFLDMLVAAMKDAALNNSVTQLQMAFDPTEKSSERTHLVRLAVFPDAPVEMSKEQIMLRISAMQAKPGKDSGIHYSFSGTRIIVVPESLTFNFPTYAPLGTPDNSKSN